MKELLHLIREDAKTLVGLFTGGGILLQAQNRKENKPNLSICGDDLATVEHIMSYCEAVTKNIKLYIGRILLRGPASKQLIYDRCS